MTGAREPAGVSWSPLASEVALRKALRRIGVGLLAVTVAMIGLPAPAYASGQNLLVQRYSGKCMDVRGDSDSVGAYVQQYDCNHTRAQEWTIALVPGSSNLYTFTAGDGLCLEDRSSFMFNGAPVDQAQCNPYAPQMQWRFFGPSGPPPHKPWVWAVPNPHEPPFPGDGVSTAHPKNHPPLAFG